MTASTDPRVSGILKRYGQQYLDRFGHTMTAQQKKVLRVVMTCRTETLGTIRYRCLGCGSTQTVPRSCCNRHCPACQHERVQAWLAQQTERLLPCHYFLVTFTVPLEVRAAMLAHPKEGYTALMTAAAESIKTAATNERHVGAREVGMFGVLHTWGRDLTYHPHVHFVVAGGGIGSDRKWRSSRVNYFVPEKVLGILFRHKLQDRLRGTKCFDAIPAQVWQRDWTVDSIAVGDGRAALKYLAPYVMRGPVSDWRVTSCNRAESIDEARLVMQVKRSGTSRYRPLPLSVTEFIRRWLLHVLPAGLHRVRHYGFLNSSSKRSLEEVRWLVLVANELLHYLACSEQLVMNRPSRMVCPECGGAMICLGYVPPPTGVTDTLQLTRAPP